MPEPADALSSASPVARALYEELLHALAPFGAFEVEVKKTSIHLVRSSAFAGVHPRTARGGRADAGQPLVHGVAGERAGAGQAGVRVVRNSEGFAKGRAAQFGESDGSDT